MNRIPILAGGAVLAAVVLCGGAVTVANAFTTSQPTSQVLSISGVTTADSRSASTSDPTATPTPTAAPTGEPGDDNGGVTVVTPSDPTKIDGKGCAHMGRDGADDPADHDATDDHGGKTGTHDDGENEPGHHEFLPGSSTQGGTDGHHHRGGFGGGSFGGSGGGDGSGHH